MKLRLPFLSLLLVVGTFLWATIPAGYYTSAETKNTANLRTALQSIITSSHSVTSYDGLWTSYHTTDINPATGKIWDMYSNCEFTWSVDQNSGVSGPECTNYNREHSVPQSWFGEASPMVSELFHVYPSDTHVNGMRGNYPYGEVGTASYTSQNGSKLGSSSNAGYAGTVFEPIDEYKGDFARTYFYMATRYASVCQNWASGATVVFGSNLGFTTYAVNLFLSWSRSDPVSAKEISRNDAVYAIQHNRNPYIDYPGTEELIWGNNTTGSFSTNQQVVVVPTVTTPSSTSILTTSASIGGNITSTGGANITESGIYYSTNSGFADGAGTKVTASATGTGLFSTSVTGLNVSTTYYFKAYATNSAGAGYSLQSSFVTITPVVAPTITTPALQTATSTNAIVSANVTNNGGEILTERGFYWSTTNGFADGAGTKIAVAGTSTGAFSTTIGLLSTSTTYYFKGFASNSAGTVYTSQASFTTTAMNSPSFVVGTVIGSGSIMDFGKVSSALSKTVFIKAIGLSGDLTVAADGEMFSASSPTIIKENADSGFLLTITYNPTAVGAHTGQVIISGGGLTNPYTISLTGQK